MYRWRLVWSISREIYAILLLCILNVFSQETLRKLLVFCLKDWSVLSHQRRLLFSCTCKCVIWRCTPPHWGSVIMSSFASWKELGTAGQQHCGKPGFCLGTFHVTTFKLTVQKTRCTSELHSNFKNSQQTGRITHKHITFLICLDFPQSGTFHFLHACNSTRVSVELRALDSTHFNNSNLSLVPFPENWKASTFSGNLGL